MIVAYKEWDRAVFLYGFAKNERENIEPAELEDLRAMGWRWLHLPADRLAGEIAAGRLQEVDDVDDEERGREA